MATCTIVSAEHESFLQEYAEPGEQIDARAVDTAFSLWQQGELSADTLNAVQSGFQNGCTVPEVTPDKTSRVEPALDSLESPAPGEIVATWTVANVPTSGGGAEVSTTVTLTVDGSAVATEQVTLPPYDTHTSTTTITNAPVGQPEVCVEV